MLTVFHSGISWVQYTSMSRMMRIDGRIGVIHSFCAMYSLSMSFCSVPRAGDAVRRPATRPPRCMPIAGKSPAH